MLESIIKYRKIEIKKPVKVFLCLDLSASMHKLYKNKLLIDLIIKFVNEHNNRFGLCESVEVISCSQKAFNLDDLNDSNVNNYRDQLILHRMKPIDNVPFCRFKVHPYLMGSSHMYELYQRLQYRIPLKLSSPVKHHVIIVTDDAVPHSRKQVFTALEDVLKLRDVFFSVFMWNFESTKKIADWWSLKKKRNPLFFFLHYRHGYPKQIEYHNISRFTRHKKKPPKEMDIRPLFYSDKFMEWVNEW